MPWVRHPDTKAVVDVPATAVPLMAGSGWQALTADETAAHLAAGEALAREQEAAMRPADPSSPADAGEPDDTDTSEGTL